MPSDLHNIAQLHHGCRTLVELFARRVAESGDRLALYAPVGGQWIAHSWREIADEVACWSAALTSLGVRPGDRIIQISENRYEWILADLAIHLAGAVHVAVHATLSGPQMAFQILDTDARLVLLSREEVARQLACAAVDWPHDVRFVSYEPVAERLGGHRVEAWTDLVRTGSSCKSGPSDSFEALAAASTTTKPDDLATILYSSGTTGEPKGVMLSDGNLLSNAIATDVLFEAGESDVKLCWLPLSHIFARTCDLYCWIVRGSEMVLAESRDTILANCQQFRPTLINGVPYFFDKVHRYVVSQGGSDGEQTKCLQEAFGGRLEMACSAERRLPMQRPNTFVRMEYRYCKAMGSPSHRL